MGISDLWQGMNQLPDHAQLGGRVYVVDGVNPNLTVEWDGGMRPIGCLGQQQDFAVTPAVAAGGGLTEGNYVWGVRRVLTDGFTEILSPVTLSAVLTLTTGQNSGNVYPLTYEGPTLPDGWAIKYQILRSVMNATTLLKLVTTLDAIPETTFYADETADAALDESVTYSLDAVEMNYPLPPVRFIRAYKGRLIGAGSLRVTRGTLTTTAASATVTLAGDIVRWCDIGAEVRISGEVGVRVIVAADPTANSWTLSKECANNVSDAVYSKQFASDVVYVTNPQPDNVEAMPYGTEVYSNAGSGNRVCGLAEAAGNLYVFRESRVETLQLAVDATVGDIIVPGMHSLPPLPDSPPGPVSHATIADRWSPKVYWYAGLAGVFELSGTTAKLISEPVDKIIREDVDHDFDAFSHGVYDPRSGMYHLWMFRSGDVVRNEAGAITFRVPSLMLTYDTRRQQWYSGTLAASRSGIWRDAAGHPYAVIGIGGGVAALDVGTVDGFGYAGTATAGGADTLTDDTANWTANALAGLPIRRVRADGVVERRIILGNSATMITVWKAWDVPAAVDETFEIGAIEFELSTGELFLASAPDTEKRSDKVAVTFDPPTTGVMPVSIEITGSRARSASTTTSAAEITPTVDFVKLTGAQQGGRGHGLTVTVRGRSRAGGAVLGIVLDAVDTK